MTAHTMQSCRQLSQALVLYKRMQSPLLEAFKLAVAPVRCTLLLLPKWDAVPLVHWPCRHQALLAACVDFLAPATAQDEGNKEVISSAVQRMNLIEAVAWCLSRRTAHAHVCISIWQCCRQTVAVNVARHLINSVNTTETCNRNTRFAPATGLHGGGLLATAHARLQRLIQLSESRGHNAVASLHC